MKSEKGQQEQKGNIENISLKEVLRKIDSLRSTNHKDK